MSHLSHASARSSRSSSPASPAPKRRATSSARRELWLRGGYSSDDDDDRPSDSDSRGGSANPEDSFAQPPPDDNHTTFSYLGKSCLVINSPEANQFLCGFQLQGSDKTCFNPKCTIRSHRIPEAASPVLRPGVYFRTGPSGISASRIWNLPVADLSILELYSDLLSRIEEYKPTTWYTILKLMAELEDIAHCEDQVTRLTTVHPRTTNETNLLNVGNDQDSTSSVPSDDDAKQ